MKNLSQFRTSLVLFSVGLLGVVSVVFDGKDSTSLIDSTTGSVARRAETQSSGKDAEQKRVALLHSGAPDAVDDQSPTASAEGSGSSPWGFDAQSPAPQPSISALTAPPPTTVVIYK